MKTLTANEIKKGEKLFIVSDWNFIYGYKKEQDSVRDDNGKWIYTPHTIDVYRIGFVTVHSCGKKRMYLMDENGMKGASLVVDDNGGFYSYHFTKTREEAELTIKELFKNDPQSIAVKYEIIENNFVR